jgi:hypothetical protein
MITTEKDAVRLAYNPYFPNNLKPVTYYLPIAVKMIPGLENLNLTEDIKKAINS